jgi:molybdopterin molybdotransferase
MPFGVEHFNGHFIKLKYIIMISVEEATSIILANKITPHIKKVSVHEALGRVLAEVAAADRDFPPFDRATMDGIAISYQAHQNGQREFNIESMQAAGQPKGKLSNSAHCIEIMTGACIPEGTDTVIPYENLTVNSKVAVINGNIEPHQNIHKQGNDAKKSDKLLSIGTMLSGADIALLASIGKSSVAVFELPKAAIISTGNELVDIDQTLLPHQVRKSNSYALQAAYKNIGGESVLFHLADDETIIAKELEIILSKFDLVLLSGGVSKGKFDFIPQRLEALAIKKLFHQVSQKPGKPMWFGRSESKFVFALPGNPVSTFMCFHKYVKPWALASLGVTASAQKAILATDYSFKAPLTYFLQVKLKNEEGKLMAYPATGGGSGDFVNLKEVDGFLELPKEETQFKTGEAYPIIQFR